MRTIPLALLLVAGCATVPAENETYRALGTEPFWFIAIANGRMTYESPDGTFSIPAPRGQELGDGRIWESRRITLQASNRECSDRMSDNRYPQTVRAVVDGRTLNGCGGPATPTVAAQMPDYEADGMEPRSWYLAIGGGRMTLQWTGAPPLSVPVPQRRTLPNGYRYESGPLTVEVWNNTCENVDGNRQADTVIIIARGLRFEGCGGGFLTPDPWNMPLGRIRRPDG